MFTPNDLKSINQRGISLEQVHEQLSNFRRGFSYLPIDRPATIGDGIQQFTESEISAIESRAIPSDLSRIKFVPASGAATRMFKEMFEFVADPTQKSHSVGEVLENLPKFAFYDDLISLDANASDPTDVATKIIGVGLNYGILPKALIKFHRYADFNRTALEEHLVEGALYAKNGDSRATIHFTISPEHMALFEAKVEEVVERYEKQYGVRFDLSFSGQHASTDTIAVDELNVPFRRGDGSLLFRPAGHGALIENLNALDADIIYIKTIDNVAPDRLRKDTIRYKKALTNIGLDVQTKAFDYIHQIDHGVADLAEVRAFIEASLGYTPTAESDLRAILDRPIRVCGMVKNEGEPGGGPFWVKDLYGSMSLQIAESTQIAPEQKHLMATATHFNPVDLICFTKDHTGKKFDLKKYTDPATGFITNKSENGQPIKAQELPGLWNGAMARWNTMFVEVPISTFSPVKTINDLLRPEHQ